MADDTEPKRRRIDSTNYRHTDITTELRRYAILKALDENFLSTVTIGYVFNKGCTALLVTSSGDVYGVSRAADISSDRLAADDTKKDEQTSDNIEIPVLKRIEQLSNKNVVDFASSDKQVVALTKEINVYICDTESCVEQLTNSLPASTQTGDWSVIGFRNTKFIQTAFGREKTFLLTQKGELLSWNGNISNSESCCVLTHRVKHIVCGLYETWMLTDKGYLQNPSFRQDNKMCAPTKLISSIEHIECGDTHVIALSKGGEVYAKGNNNEGQLGIGKDQNYGSAPNALKFANKSNITFVSIAAYKNLSAAQTVTGKVYVWGECLDRVLFTPTETYITRLNNVFPILAQLVITPKAIKSENKDQLYSVKHSIAGLFDDIEDSDVTFKVRGKTIHTHKLLLKNRCEHFRLMFSSEWKESTTGVIEITNFTYEVYRAFLYYLYTDELDITYEDAVEMLDLAQSYSATDLKLRCERVIEWWIRDNNAATIYQLAVKYESSILQEACVQYGVDNLNRILLSAAFKEIELQIGRDFVIRIAEKRPNK